MALSEQAKRLLPIGMALIAGVIAVSLMQQYVRGKERELAREWARIKSQYPEPVEAVVAAKDLEPGILLDASHLASASIPERFLQPYAARSPQEAIGLVTLAPMAEGEQILQNKLRRPEEAPLSGILSGVIQQGERAVTIGVDAISGVGGFVQPGDTVDVLWTVNVPSPDKSGNQPVTWALFQDVPVLAVGGTMVGGVRQGTTEGDAYTVTLSLPPQQTSFLLFAREQGRIQLSLRSRFEKGVVKVAPANAYTLMEQQLGLSVPAPGAPQGHQVEVYKGLKRDVVVLSEDAGQRP